MQMVHYKLTIVKITISIIIIIIIIVVVVLLLFFNAFISITI